MNQNKTQQTHWNTLTQIELSSTQLTAVKCSQWKKNWAEDGDVKLLMDRHTVRNKMHATTFIFKRHCVFPVRCMCCCSLYVAVGPLWRTLLHLYTSKLLCSTLRQRTQWNHTFRVHGRAVEGETRNTVQKEKENALTQMFNFAHPKQDTRREPFSSFYIIQFRLWVLRSPQGPSYSAGV